MDNAQKAIMIGVGLFITIIIIAAVMLITGMGQNLLNKGQSQVEGISESLMNDLTAQYDGKIMSGTQVRTAAVQIANRNDPTVQAVIRFSDKAGDYKTIKETTDETTKKTTSATQVANDALRGRDNQRFKGKVVIENKIIKVKFFMEGTSDYSK